MQKNLWETALSQHIQQRHYIALDTQYSDTEGAVQCIPISKGETLLLLLRFFDFVPDGYEIMSLSDVSRVEHSLADAFFETAVKGEGACALVDGAPSLSLESWQTAFREIKALDCVIIVETGDGTCASVGKVKDVLSDSVSLTCITPEGQWEEEPWQEQFRDILRVRLYSNYARMYEKYGAPERK